MNRCSTAFVRCTILLVQVLSLHAGLCRAADPVEPAVQAIRVPGGGIHPQVQMDRQGILHLIYFTGDPRHGDIFYTRSSDTGATFTSPMRVNSQAGSAVIIGTMRGPHLALGKGDRPHVAWMGSDQAEPKTAKSAPMLYARLNAAGDAFEPQRNVIQNHPGLDGGGSIAADRNGNVYIAWHAPEHDKPGAEMSEADRRVWITRSQNNGATFSAEMPAVADQTGACGCCGLNTQAVEDGRVFIVFRSATEMVHRDIHVLVSKDFGKTFAIESVDPWNVGKCVMSTAAFTRRGDEVMGAWETKEQVRFAVLGGASAKNPPITMPLTMPKPRTTQKYPTLAANDRGDVLVAWAEDTGWNRGGAVVWQIFDRSGRPIDGASGRVDRLAAWSLPAAFVDGHGRFKIIY